MSKDNFNKEIAKAKAEFITNLPKLINSLSSSLDELHGRKKSEVDLSVLSNLVRELHNIKSVAGSYGIDFIVSAIRNVLDHTSGIYDLDEGDYLDLDLTKKIFELLNNFLQNYQDDEVHHEELDSLLRSDTSKKRVLIVENDEKLIGHFKEIFEKRKISYSVVSSGIEAFNRLLNEKYDLLLTDLHVGKLDGPSLIAATRVSNGINKEIKTIMLSVSYFDLLPSISMPDFFISKNENILSELASSIDKFISEDALNNEEEKIKILSLDDDTNIHDLLKISFSSHAIDYRSSINGGDFISKYRESKPDLVLLDLILDDESGVEVIKKLKSMDASFDVPVIVLTSLKGKLKSDLLSEVPFIIGALSKPFTPKAMAKDVIGLFNQNKRTFKIG
jgi:DNA-binding response OmpR family regulator